MNTHQKTPSFIRSGMTYSFLCLFTAIAGYFVGELAHFLAGSMPLIQAKLSSDQWVSMFVGITPISLVIVMASVLRQEEKRNEITKRTLLSLAFLCGFSMYSLFSAWAGETGRVAGITVLAFGLLSLFRQYVAFFPSEGQIIGNRGLTAMTGMYCVWLLLAKTEHALVALMFGVPFGIYVFNSCITSVLNARKPIEVASLMYLNFLSDFSQVIRNYLADTTYANSVAVKAEDSDQENVFRFPDVKTGQSLERQ